MAYTVKQKDKAKQKIVQCLYDGYSLKSILESDKDMPSRPIIYKWLNSESKDFDKEFLNNYTRARCDSADLDVDKIEDLNNELRSGEIEPAHARVIADNLKWTAGRKAPKKYGDKLQLDQNIKDESPKININVDGKQLDVKI